MSAVTGATVVVHLVRHGETATYGADAGLTPRGREQAAERGRALAAEVPHDVLLGVEYAPTERARETAEVLLAAYLDGAPFPDPVSATDFRNLQVYVGPDARPMEPTAARALLIGDDGKPADAGTGIGTGWMIEARRFWTAHEQDGDAMGFWLTTPLLWHESPAQVVRRMVGAMLRRAATAERAGHVVVAGHSGCLRALVAWASGTDHGEPENAAELAVTVHPAGERLVVRYLGNAWTMPVPAGLGMNGVDLPRPEPCG